MRYRNLGNTGLRTSEIGFGGEWMDQTLEETQAVVDACEKAGINLLDCWMPDPTRRSNLGDALAGRRERWIIQGHVGSTWQDGQYVRTRRMDPVKAAFEDLLERFHTDYMDIGMIHYVDKPDEYREIMDGTFMAYMRELLATGAIRHIGLSTHNPEVAKLAATETAIEVIMFSANPAFDMMPPTDELDDLFGAYDDESLDGIDRSRAELYALCETTNTALTLMKPYAGGRLLSPQASPFGIALTPVQCIHYALTRPAAASVLPGFSSTEHVSEAVAYENASVEELDYASVLAGAPRNAYMGQCTYCGHCAPCAAGIDIATVNKYFDLASMHNQAPDSVCEHYKALDVTAQACIACRLCEERCPFDVKIAEKMAQAQMLFGC